MAKVTDLTGRPFSGLVPYPVVALVVDNVDPDELGRIKVKFPTLHEEPLSFWLRQIAPMAGIERGYYALPEPDDEVLVLFMQGGHDVGVIIGALWNGIDLPPKECKDTHPEPSKNDTGASWSTDTFTDGSRDLEKNDRRFLKSRSGALMLFDDTDGAESVQLWDKGHVLSFVFDTAENRIILANTQGDLHIRSKMDIYIEAGQDIKWRAGRDIIGESVNDTTHTVKNNWTVDVTNEASLKSGADFKIESMANLTCKASITTKVEGGVSFEAKGGTTAKLEGGAMTEIKGGMVKIN